MSIETGELMTIPQLQNRLGGIGRSKTYELIRTGQIKSYKIGRLLRVRHEDVDAYLEANQYSPPVTTREKSRRS